MDNFFDTQLAAQELRRQLAQRRQHQHQHQHQAAGHAQDDQTTGGVQGGQANQPGQHALSSMADATMFGGDSLDDIIRENHVQLQRRRSVVQPYGGAGQLQQGDETGRVMGFGNGSGGGFANFQFSNDGLGSGFSGQMRTLDTNLQMAEFGQPGMMAMGGGPDLTNLSPTVMGNMMSATFANMTMGQMGGDASGVDLFAPSNMPMTTQYPLAGISPVSADFMNLTRNDVAASAGTVSDGIASGMATGDETVDVLMSNQPFGAPGARKPKNRQSLDLSGAAGSAPAGTPASISREPLGTSSFSQAPAVPKPKALKVSPSTPAAPMMPSAAPSPVEPKEKSIYSKTGFDMVKALWYVGARKNPEIRLGSVDFSCAFVVCDITLNDCPIIYVSDNFQNLTGYSRHEIVGQNCRFLQAPDGKVEAGSRREFVDNEAVYNLKQKITEGREVQQSLLNYRKGGKPFLNLLTMIPIPWDTDEIRYFVGFQIDLVECPDALADGGGIPRVDYKHSDIGQYIWSPPAATPLGQESGQTLGVDDVSTLLQQLKPKGTTAVSDWHKQSWDKMLLENTDDVVHVLSLKGLFLYLSPSCKRALEYDVGELVGTALSTICHPSDIVPVTRELKDATAGEPVNIVFRIMRKSSGYTWFESHGSLFAEHGKGRKCIILVGRPRPVFTLSRRVLEANGGIGDSEMWSKLSASGMFLFVSSNVRALLDIQADSLVGTSIQELMRKESRHGFGRMIELARREGRVVRSKHEVHNRRGQVIQAQTILYPGDALEGGRPTFFLAQTRLIKASSRTIAPATDAANQSGANVSASRASQTPADAGTRDDSLPAPPAPPAPSSVGTPLPGAPQDVPGMAADNIFDELRTTKCSSWQFELRQMEKVNRILAEELAGLLSNKKKRKRRKGSGNVVRDCANCHTRNTPEWRRGPSGQRDLCNSCGLRWAKQIGRVSPRNSSRGGNSGNGGNGDGQSKMSASPAHSSPSLHGGLGDSPPEGEKPASLPGNGAGGQATAGNGSSSSSSGSKTQQTVPPPSQLLLDGKSGHELTAIREERETSTT